MRVNTGIQLQSLTANSLRAAMQANSQPLLSEVSALPTAIQDTKQYKLPLTCQYTGVSCGQLLLPTTAGYLPLLSQWKQQQVLHPLFSLEVSPLLEFSKRTWIRFCGFSQEEAEDAVLTSKQEQMLQIAALALLHQLTEVRQDVPWLPSFVEVQNNWQSLISLSYWKAYLDSKRFSFPTVRVSKLESSINLQAFLSTCWERKNSYEGSASGLLEEAKAELAEKALLGISNELAGKRPNSQKLLWQWFLANLPKKFLPDSEGWMKTMYFSKSILDTSFTMADIDLFEEIFLSCCPIGSSISHAFLEVLASKRKLLEQHFEAFEILVPQSLQAAAAMGEIAVAEPVAADYPRRILWIVAHAKWRLTHGAAAANKHRDAAAAKQQRVTVKTGYSGLLDTGRTRDFDCQQEEQEAETEQDAISYVAPDSVTASLQDDLQATSGDYEE